MMKRILLLLIFIITISLFNNGTTLAEGPKNYLKGKFYSSVKNHFLIATKKSRGCFITLKKSAPVKPKPNTNIIKARAKGKITSVTIFIFAIIMIL